MIASTSIPIIQRVLAHGRRLAIIDELGEHEYADILNAALRVANTLLQGDEDLEEAPVAFMAPPGNDYVAAQWGIWLAGGIAVPLCLSHPLPEITYVLDDTGARALLVHPEYAKKLAACSDRPDLRFIVTSRLKESIASRLPDVGVERRAMILYTSGTTSKPKGVVTTHANITAMITSLIEAWEWQKDDCILHVLPLHHAHGIINILLCAMWAGATCEMLPTFDASRVWRHFTSGQLTLFMAVPTIYNRLTKAWNEMSPVEKKGGSAACAGMRLMVSGSAALPVSVLETWHDISGHTLLERYGMTEIGMALANPLHGTRRPGSVGLPLPGVEVRLVDEHASPIMEEGIEGEIQIKGPNVFLEYWNRPKATKEAFIDGWFCTGDMAVVEGGYYRILGRSSVDIIKTGGYKVSALEIEEVLRTHPEIQECAVVGMADPDWGERVCAAVVCSQDTDLELNSLRTWGKERLALYKVPSRILILDSLPRNVMGKVTKPAVKELFNH